jgi:hypothetical protein
MQPCVAVVAVRHINAHRLELTFSDGVRALIDLAPRVIGRGGIFQPLEDPEYFRRVRVDPDLGTIVWPNGADICPDQLHDWATGGAVMPPEPQHAVP